MNEKNLKQYLKDGYVVVTSDGEYGFIANRAIIFNDSKSFISFYNPELKYPRPFKCFDIVKILKPTKTFCLTDMFDGKFEHTVVWESELNTEQETKSQDNTKSKNDIYLFSVEIFVKNLGFSSVQLKLTHDQFRQLCDQLASPLVQNICVGHSQGLFYTNKENISLIHSFSDF